MDGLRKKQFFDEFLTGGSSLFSFIKRVDKKNPPSSF